jgi:hypothetical protein
MADMSIFIDNSPNAVDSAAAASFVVWFVLYDGGRRGD